MKLLSLKLRNFKGIKSFTLDAQGRNASVFGDNATGKTTLFDAFTWLLFDKDSSDRANFEIKTLKPNGEPHHGLDHEVEAELEVEGRVVTLRKAFKEKWTKKRGSATAEFTGHTTDFFIDGVPVKKKDYDAKTAEIADDSIFKLLTSPTYFNEVLHWNDRRQILLEVCGDISDADVIASDKALAKLPDILKGRKLEDMRKIIMARRAEVNRELERIPVRIDEAERNLPNIEGIVIDELGPDIKKARTEVRELEQQLNRAESGGEIAEKRKQLREIEAQLLDIQNQHRREVDGLVADKQKAYRDLQNQINDAQATVRRAHWKLADFEKEYQQLDSANAQLRDRWHEISSREFTFEQAEVCPTCGQDIPKSQLQEARDKALAAFNREKAKELEAVSERGKQNAERIKEIEADMGVLRDKDLPKTEKYLARLEQQAKAVQTEIDELLNGITDIEQTPEYKAKLKEKTEIELEMAQLKTSAEEVARTIREQISKAREVVQVLEAAQLQLKQHERGLERIEELKQQERELAAEYERLEQELYLTEQFVRTKVALLEDRINSKFKLARFKLFDVQINGAIAECCETMYKGVPYSGGLNNGARINVGLDIINTLSEHYGFAPPIFIDNAEAVTQLLPTRGQQIRLIVSEADKALRVEIEGKQVKLKEAV